MPLRRVPDTEVDYHLVLFDEDGAERTEDDGTLHSSQVLEAAAGVTDVFLISHGWKGDIPAAIRQYDAWVGAMARQEKDRQAIRSQVTDFKALVVGAHWPSLPWGVEDTGAALLGEDEPEAEGGALAAEEALPTSELVDLYAGRLGDDPATRSALETVLAAADDPAAVDSLEKGSVPSELEDAYRTLFEGSGLADEGALGAPGADHPAFDPALVVEQWAAVDGTAAPDDDLLLGWGDDLKSAFRSARAAVLGPVRQLSFWTMKRRARLVGERGVHALLAAIQEAAPDARVHLMGHSFGCIVVSAAVAGPSLNGQFTAPLPRPVDAVLLVQGAMSLWSYAEKVPFLPGRTGFFQPVLEPQPRIRGPLVTTRSSFDTAVGKYYPLGAKVGGSIVLGDGFPEYGAIGAFGIQGATVDDRVILAASESYGLVPGTVVNVDADRVICNGSGPSGAHSDIAHDEVAHLMWQAVSAAAG